MTIKYKYREEIETVSINVNALTTYRWRKYRGENQ